MNPLAVAAEAQRLAMRRFRATLSRRRPTPTPPDPQWAIRQPAFPARERERPAVFYGERARYGRAVDPETELEKRAGWGDR